MNNKCSNYPQNVAGGKIWYYEYPGHIHVIVSREWRENAVSDGSNFKISRRMLEASLKRMNASRRQRKKATR